MNRETNVFDGIREFGRIARSLAQNPLGIIALFVVLVYGIAALVVLGAPGDKLDPSQKQPLIWFLLIFPFVLLGVFVWLVTRHPTKIYSPSDFRSDEAFLRSLSLEEQKGRLENEVLASTASTHLVSTSDATRAEPQPQLSASAMKGLKSDFVLAQDLVFRRLEIDRKIRIHRQMQVGVKKGPSITLDGVAFAPKGLIAIAVKFIREPVVMERFEDLINDIEQIVKKEPDLLSELIIVVVRANHSVAEKPLTTRLRDLVRTAGLTISWKVYDFEGLKKYFGL